MSILTARQFYTPAADAVHRAWQTFAERLLLALSRAPGPFDYHLSEHDATVETALDLFRQQFGPALSEHIRGKRIADYGCGDGRRAVACLLHGAAQVTGVDIQPASITQSHALAERYGVASRLSVRLGDTDRIRLPDASFDTIISCNAFEHYGDPAAVLRVCYQALRPHGLFIITFSPPWFHPYGSHMQFFTRVPWVHVFFSERTVMSVRQRFRRDGARRYGEVQGGLNQMTVQRFVRLVEASPFRVESLTLRGIKRQDWVTRLPLVREVFTNRVNCVLRKT